MKKSLAHLPEPKREELKIVVETILEECPTAQMIILFGSYARGDWVEDCYVEDNVTYEYASGGRAEEVLRSAQPGVRRSPVQSPLSGHQEAA